MREPLSRNRTILTRVLAPTGGWKRRAATLGAALAVAAGIALAEGKPSTRGLKPQAINVIARPIAAFDKENKDRKRFGRLEWRGGLVLSSDTVHFGGLSGLSMDATGRMLAAVSDGGTWLTGELAYEAGRPAGIKGARFGPLQSTSKSALVRNRDIDAEAISIVEGTLEKGTALISFEQNDRIGRFAIDARGVGSPIAYLPIPPEMKRVRSSDGFEALTVMRGGPMKGNVIAFAEHVLPGQVHHSGWIWVAGAPKRLSLTNIGGFDLTDAASLDDGSLVILERRFRWSEGVKMRLRLIPAGSVGPGALLAGEVLMEADLNSEIDNMEGLGVHTGPAGETVLTLISDDNFNSLLQRTILLQFALTPPHAQENAKRAPREAPAAGTR